VVRMGIGGRGKDMSFWRPLNDILFPLGASKDGRLVLLSTVDRALKIGS
jgi:hypothetical protein